MVRSLYLTHGLNGQMHICTNTLTNTQVLLIRPPSECYDKTIRVDHHCIQEHGNPPLCQRFAIRDEESGFPCPGILFFSNLFFNFQMKPHFYAP